MAIETTFAIIKPNAMKKNVTGKVIEKWEAAGLKVVGCKIIHMTQARAEEFYAEHKARPFFGELVSFMTSLPVMVVALHGENAVARNREVMGATNPAQAAEGTIRKLFGDNVGENAVHGSDSIASANRELGLFFERGELFK